LIQIKDPLVILYNDRSILENNYFLWYIIQKNNNFLEHEDKEKVNEFRKVIIINKMEYVFNVTKEKPIYKRWVDRIMEEFYWQGDTEKKFNILLSPFDNRDNANPNGCQKSFIEFIT